MTYLLWQIFACLLGTAVIFLVLGWLLREWRLNGSSTTGNLIMESERARWQTSLAGLKGRMETENGRRLAAEKALEDSRGQQSKISLLLDQHTTEIRSLSQELTDKDKALEQREACVRQLQARIAEMESQQGSSQDLEKARDALNMQLAALTSQAGTHGESLQAANEDLAKEKARAADLEKQLADRDAKLASLQAISDENNKLKAKVSETGPKLAAAVSAGVEAMALRARVADLEPKLKAVAEENSKLKTQVSELAPKLAMAAAAGAEVLHLKSQHAQPAAGNNHVPVNGERDDLKKIFGIGPVLEKRLNGLGVYFFRDIANWTREDILRYEDLKEFPHRIERDHWVEGAREAHFKKYGKDLLKAKSA